MRESHDPVKRCFPPGEAASDEIVFVCKWRVANALEDGEDDESEREVKRAVVSCDAVAIVTSSCAFSSTFNEVKGAACAENEWTSSCDELNSRTWPS